MVAARRILTTTALALSLSLSLSQASATNANDDDDDNGFAPSIDIARERAPQIFNAVHDAMRQWGASLHHNGMSFFLATVPEGVILHHGNSNERSPDEPDWLAFEIEHAENFARGGMPPPGRRPGGGGPPGGGPPGGGPPAAAGALLGSESEGDAQHALVNEAASDQESLAAPSGGWLHTYRAAQPLRYLYIDGMSGGKTSMGTLDSQDYLLRHAKETSARTAAAQAAPSMPGGGPMDERSRASELCALCKEWNLAGTIRMEAGFEIIHCNFSQGLRQLQALRRPDPGSSRKSQWGFGSFEFVRGLAERYDGIGASRASVDYSSMVSAFFFPVNLTNPDPARPDLPRLLNADAAELAAVRAYLNQTVARHQRDDDDDGARTIDWQDVTDLVVGRYADRIKYMAEKATTARQIADELDFLLTTFVDYSGRDDHDDQVARAIDRCTNVYLHAFDPATEADTLVHAAVTTVTSAVCTTLFHVRELVGGDDDDADDESRVLARAVAALKALMDRLQWARFKRCAACAVDEVCAIPMWPLGRNDTYYAPRCVNATTMNEGESYWGRPGFGGPPGRGGPGDGEGRRL